MRKFTEAKNILWDFDGVILDSMSVRDYGFMEVLKEYPNEKVNILMDYHRANGGLSRYVKFRYFFETILNRSISVTDINHLADRFSTIMRNELPQKKYLIEDTICFIRNNYTTYNMHIVSGSDEKELLFLSNELGIHNYFISIHGSPTPKNKLVENLLTEYSYEKNETILIGDSINDKVSADLNNISFFGYNNETLKSDYPNSFYIEKFII